MDNAEVNIISNETAPTKEVEVEQAKDEDSHRVLSTMWIPTRIS